MKTAYYLTILKFLDMPKKKKSQDPTTPPYPTATQAKTASDWQIRSWYNNLPAPDTAADVDAMKIIIKRNRSLKKATHS